MAFRAFTSAPTNKWVLQALAASQVKGFPFKLILFFDIDKVVLRQVIAWAQLREAPKGEVLGGFYLYKAAFIVQLYNAYDFFLFLGDYVALLCSFDVEGFLRELLKYSQEEPPVRLAGCLLFGAFASLWPPAATFLGAGEHFINVSARQAYALLYDIAWLHSKGGGGLFYIYRLLLKVPHFHSCFLFFLGFWPFFYCATAWRQRKP